VLTILITGAAGLLGRILGSGLGDQYTIQGIDRDASRRSGVQRADLAKEKGLDSFFEGVDVVVDLAAIAGVQTPWNEVWRNNVRATLNVLEAARLAKVTRVVFASSNHVTGGYEREQPYAAIVAGEYGGLESTSLPLIDTSWPIRPDGPYALGKALGEAAARYYSDAFGLSVLCLRIGTVNAQDSPREPRHFATLLSHGDLVGLAEAAISAPADVQFGVYYGVSRNTWRFWDIESARDEIGYTPQDNAERFRQAV
jgi:nucleoside-diphosphate-sugar epimerase